MSIPVIPLVTLIPMYLVLKENVKYKKWWIPALFLGACVTIYQHALNIIMYVSWNGLLLELYSGTTIILIFLVFPYFYDWLAGKRTPFKNTNSRTIKRLEKYTSNKECLFLFVVPILSYPFFAFIFSSSSLAPILSPNYVIFFQTVFTVLFVIIGWTLFRHSPKRYLISASALYLGYCIGVIVFGITTKESIPGLVVGGIFAFAVIIGVVWFMRNPKMSSALYLMLVIPLLYFSVEIYSIQHDSIPWIILLLFIINIWYPLMLATTLIGLRNYRNARENKESGAASPHHA